MSTILDGPEFELTPEERAADVRAAREAAQRNLTRALAFASADNAFAKMLCSQVADSFSPKLLVPQKKRGRGRPRRWTRARLYELLVVYEVRRRLFGRAATLKFLVEREVQPPIEQREIEKRITQARKMLTPLELSELQASLPEKQN